MLKVKKTTKGREKQIEIFNKGVYEVFDRIPNGSLISSKVNDLVDKIVKG